MSDQLLSASQLVELEQAARDWEQGQLTRERYEEVIASLTPEQRELWESLAPAVLDADMLFEQIVNSPNPGGGWKK